MENELKQKQIEEMARDLCNRYSEVMERCLIDHYGCNYTCGYYDNAKTLYEKNYRKIPDGAVVLTKEEYEEYQDLLKNFDNYLFEYRKFADGCIKDTRNETVEKFARKAKEQFADSARLCEQIDEIAKEIAEGKV